MNHLRTDYEKLPGEQKDQVFALLLELLVRRNGGGILGGFSVLNEAKKIAEVFRRYTGEIGELT